MEVIEIPFGAKDSELKGWEYTIPEGFTAEIKGGKVIVKEKESEDEKIRKHIVKFIDEQYPTHGSLKDEKDKMLAYLEKQKQIVQWPNLSNCKHDCKTCFAKCIYRKEQNEEQKPLMSDGEIEDKKRDIVAAIRKYYPSDYATYLTSFLRGLSPEDNSDDEYGQEMLGIAYKLMYEHIPENLRTQEFWDSLKFMREYTGKVAIIPSYEHPAEWSEEDEENFKWFDKFFRAESILIGCKDIPMDKYLWFKSLRPQPHTVSIKDATKFGNLEYERGVKDGIQSEKSRCWKPNEEQMGALSDTLAFIPDTFKPKCTLVTLQNDLKKQYGTA